MSKNPFDYIKTINLTKQDIMKPDDEKDYPAFLVNRFYSFFLDTVLYANQMNINSGIDNRLKYDYLRTSLKKKNRFSKWPKREQLDKFNIIQQYYKYNTSKAKELLFLSDEQIKILKERLEFLGDDQ